MKYRLTPFKLIQKSKFLINNQSKDKLIYSPLNYIVSWSPDHLGNLRLKSSVFGIGSKINFIYYLLRNIIILCFIDNYRIYNKENFTKNISNVVFSWCKISDLK